MHTLEEQDIVLAWVNFKIVEQNQQLAWEVILIISLYNTNNQSGPYKFNFDFLCEAPTATEKSVSGHHWIGREMKHVS